MRKINRKVIRGLKYIVVFLLIFFWISYALPSSLLRIPQVQNRLSEVATHQLSDYLGVPVKIGHLDFEWFNRLVLEDLYLEDQQQQPLFEASHVSAGIEVLPLLKGQLVFTSARLFGFTLNLRRETPKSPLNLQFVLDAFASKDTLKPKPNINLRFNSIHIRRGNFSYQIESEPETPGRFNAKHIDLRNLSAHIALKALAKDSLNAEIKKMSFEEASGFSLQKVAFSIMANRDSAHIQRFELNLPHSTLKISRAHMDLTQASSPAEFLDNAPITLRIAPSQIALQDLSAFVPAFKNFTDTLELTAEAEGNVNDFNLQQLTLRFGEKMLFIGQMALSDITHPKDAYLNGKINKLYLTTAGLHDLAQNLSEQPVRLPDPLMRLGTINFSGEISGFADNLTAHGKLASAIGSLQLDVVFGAEREKQIAAFLQGKVASSELQLHELFGANNPFGKALFQIDLNAQKPVGGQFGGKIAANIQAFDYKGYTYHDLQLNGVFSSDRFDGKIQLDDPNVRLHAEGLFQHQTNNSQFDFTARLDHFRPDKLFLTEKYENPDLSLALNANFTGDNIDNLSGRIQVDSLSFLTAPDSFYLKQLVVEASGHSLDRQLTIQSDLLNGEIVGAYSFQTLVPSMMQTFKEYLPALINTKTTPKRIKENNFSLLLTIENTEKLSNTLKLPFTMIQQGRITGHYNNQYNRFRIEAWLPQFNIGKTLLESGHLVCDNPLDKIDLRLKATQKNLKGLRNYVELRADAKENLINTMISWANNKQQLFKADLSVTTQFREIEQPETATPRLYTEINLNPSELIIKDTLWTIHPATITISDGHYFVDHFKVERENQHLAIQGTVSKNPTDTLLLDLKQIELSYIFDILNIPVLQFAGEATGKFRLNDLFGSRILNTDLEVNNFAFNQVRLGRLSLFSEWDDEQQGILMLGSIYKNDSTWTDVNGYIYPVGANAGLSLHFDANDINIAFLQPFVEAVGNNLQGHGFGHVHLYGPFKELTVEGEAYVADGGIGVNFLDTYYTFSDSIHLDSTSVNLRNVTIKDAFGNSGKVDLTFKHHHFKDYSFDVNVQGTNMLLYDVSQKKNPMIYGKVFASGKAGIQGNNKLINFDINMQSRPKTKVYLDFMTNNTAMEYDFITFVNKDTLRHATDSAATQSTPLIAQTDDGTELRMNFLLELTPDATIELIMDPVAGDRIKGTANGSLQIQYGTKSDLRMYGDVQIAEGDYNFSLQQIIHKDFKIRDGSTINFRGDPFNANMNITASYNLTANIADLDQSLMEETGRSSVPVNCLLMLDGALRSPAISFDLEFPNSNGELERQVRALVDTEDMMTRQIVYLLVLNKFYTPEYIRTNSYKSNELNAVASSAISAQLSSILGSFTDKVQIGTNIRASQDGFDSGTEYEMLLSSQLLDNRLLINGNFGMRNTLNTGKANTFIGEFDLEYKLTPSGDIRLKAYNHARDTYYGLKQALTIQGVGIMYRKDFTNISEIFRRRRPFFSPLPADSTQIRKDTIP